jgi:D-tyrosyl-tRNA(Tyr) deacylase
MIAVIQRVKHASVSVEGETVGSINAGLLVLLGISETDSEKEMEWAAKKIADMRIFSDAEGKMNLSVKDIGGNILTVSQFTLYGDPIKGNRPSFVKAARPEKAIPLYELFISLISRHLNQKCEAGVFGADMKVSLLNDGPVTIILDSEKK